MPAGMCMPCQCTVVASGRLLVKWMMTLVALMDIEGRAGDHAVVGVGVGHLSGFKGQPRPPGGQRNLDDAGRRGAIDENRWFPEGVRSNRRCGKRSGSGGWCARDARPDGEEEQGQQAKHQAPRFPRWNAMVSQAESRRGTACKALEIAMGKFNIHSGRWEREAPQPPSPARRPGLACPMTPRSREISGQAEHGPDFLTSAAGKPNGHDSSSRHLGQDRTRSPPV